MIEKCMDRPTGHESMKQCNEKVLLGKLAFWSTVSELQPLEDNGKVCSFHLGLQHSMLYVHIVTAWYAGQFQVTFRLCKFHSVFVVTIAGCHWHVLHKHDFRCLQR